MYFDENAGKYLSRGQCFVFGTPLLSKMQHEACFSSFQFINETLN